MTAYGPRASKAEELVDVQQQADFFISLGQPEQAVEVLLSHIGDNVETSVLVFRDLFDLFHQINRRQDYAVLGERFNRVFNAAIPPFDLYTDSSPGLDAYPVIMARIEALWLLPNVLEVIEESIFRHGDGEMKPFDLEAYRELLMLYAVAKQIIGPKPAPDENVAAFELSDSGFGSPTVPSNMSAASTEPGVLPETQPARKSVARIGSPSGSLDIDLDEMDQLSRISTAHARAPEPDMQNFIDFALPDPFEDKPDKPKG